MDTLLKEIIALRDDVKGAYRDIPPIADPLGDGRRMAKVVADALDKIITQHKRENPRR